MRQRTQGGSLREGKDWKDQLTLFPFPRPATFLLLAIGPTPGSIAPAPPVICDPGPPRRFLFSFVAEGGAKLPTGGILISGRGVCTCACWEYSERTLLSIAASSLACFAAACALTCAADSGRNCLKSSSRSCAELNSCVTCAYTS